MGGRGDHLGDAPRELRLAHGISWGIPKISVLGLMICTQDLRQL